VIVVDVWQDGKSEPLMMANPEFVFLSQECADMEEGCLSVPNKTINISRPKSASVRYLDFYNKPQILHADELLATCLQHEVDHLNGITIIDKGVS
jgi:peptide deformylase